MSNRYNVFAINVARGFGKIPWSLDLLCASNLSRKLEPMEEFWNKEMNILANLKGLKGNDKVEWINKYIKEING